MRVTSALAPWVVLVLLFAALPAAAETDAASFQGRPRFSEGDALGYFIWQDGDTWKVRWTTFGAEHRFTGRVTLQGAEIRDFKRVDADTERRVIAPGRPPRVVRGPRGPVRGVTRGRGPVVATREEDRIHQESEREIRFNALTDDDLDGFDFKTSSTAGTVVRFMLRIDGRERREEVEVGRGNVKPNEDPIVVRLR